MNILLTFPFHRTDNKKIQDAGFNLTIVKEKELEWNDSFKDTEILICFNPFSKLDIRKMPNLKFIQLVSIGIDHVPLDYIKKNEISVCNAREVTSIPISEWIIAKILEIYKDTYHFKKAQKKKEWNLNINVKELFEKNIGFIGTGSIPRETVKRLKAFGVKAYGINTTGHDVPDFEKCWSTEEIDELITICDIVVIASPSTPSSNKLLNRERLYKMKKDSLLINISRGEIIDEVALVDVLNNGHLMAAALDVFENEPLSPENPLWNIPNAYVSCHNSWFSNRWKERTFKLVFNNLINFRDNTPLNFVVDWGRGY